MAVKKQHSISVLDEKRMEEAHGQLVDVWESADQYPAPSPSTQSFHHVLIFALFCSNIFFASLAVFFYSNAHCPVVPHRGDPFSVTAASHDARAHIRYEQHTFTGALKYNSTNGNLYRSSVSTSNSSEEPQYVGNPRTTPGLDRAWKTLTGGSKFPLSNEETASFVQQNTTKKSTGTVYAELDVFHSLNCLNAVRLALDHDFYREHGAQDGFGWQQTTRLDREQLDYCIDQLRQSLQCSADLSIVPMVPRSTSTSAAADFAAQPRTCRKWDDVRSWVDRRQERTRFMDQHQEQQRDGSSV